MDLDDAFFKKRQLAEVGLGVHAQAPRRIRRGLHCDAMFFQFGLHIIALGQHGVDPHIQACGVLQALHQRPKLLAQLGLQAFGQPRWQIMFVRCQEGVVCGGIAVCQPLELHIAHGGFHETAVTVGGLRLLQFGLGI